MKNLVIALLAIGLAAFVTGPKLWKMAQIKGWVPGATVQKEVVTQKWHQLPSEHHRGRHVYWVSWGTTPIREVGGHRLNLERDAWEKVTVGEALELVTVPGDRWAYTRDDIFVSAGNFMFDIALFITAIGVALWSLRKWRITRMTSRVV